MTGGAQDSGVLLPFPCCGAGPAKGPGRFTQASFSGVEVMDEIYSPYIWCGTCCLRTRACDSVAEAITAWNTRTTPAPAGWQDISSAPKDGTEVDLWVPALHGGSPHRVSDCAWKHLASGHDWYTRGDQGWQSLGAIGLYPTHFMTIPTAPAEGGV